MSRTVSLAALIVVLAGASHAIFSATGKRVRRLAIDLADLALA